MRNVDRFNAAVTGIGDPNDRRRDYELGDGLPLVGLLDNPWYPPYILDSPHVHNCMEIGVCLYGEGRLNIGGRARRFREGGFAVVPQGVEHMQNNEGAPMTHWRYVLVNEAALLAEAPVRQRSATQRILDGLRGGVYLEARGAFAGLRAAVAAMFKRYALCRDPGDMELGALLWVLMAELGRVPRDAGEEILSSTPTRRAIEPALQYVSRNYAQEVRVEQMAAACAMSESYFRKVFQAIMNMSPLEYLNRYRINRSVHLLSTTDETVLTIAGMTGFPSIATYNRNFRRFVGESPAQWRKNARR